jgi:hypothetical protein
VAAQALAQGSSLKRLRTLKLVESGITGAGVSSLIASPQLPNLTVLKLDWCKSRSWNLNEQLLAGAEGSSLRSLEIDLMHGGSLTAAATRALAGCPALRGLRSLRLSTSKLDDSALEALIRQATYTRLAMLDLSANKIGDPGATALAQWPSLRGVRCLDLAQNAVRDQGALALSESPYLEEVQVLRLSRAKLSQASREALQQRFGDAVVLL